MHLQHLLWMQQTGLEPLGLGDAQFVAWFWEVPSSHSSQKSVGASNPQYL